MTTILVLNGPNLNLLGTREPDIYGALTLDAIQQQLAEQAQTLGFKLLFAQHNHEGEIIDALHNAPKLQVKFIILNAGAYTHTSIAIRDALLAISIPFVEVHCSNLLKREPFRHQSYLSDIALGVIHGFGPFGYELALRAAHHFLIHSTI